MQIYNFTKYQLSPMNPHDALCSWQPCCEQSWMFSVMNLWLN